MFENLIVTLKVIRRSPRSVDSKSILKQSESEEAPNIQVETGSNTIQVSSAILEDQVTCLIFILLILFKLTFFLDYKYKKLLNAPLFFMNKFKNRKTKRSVEHTPFLKKIAACQSVSQCVCEIVKLSGFERPQKIDTQY